MFGRGVRSKFPTDLCCAVVPTEKDPIVLDFKTSVVAEGKVRVSSLNGKRPVPEGWLLDPQGQPTTHPAVLYESPFGSILPMGGSQAYKGFGLGLDMLSGGLTGGPVQPPRPPSRRTLQRRSAEGISLEDAHWAKLTELAGRLGVEGV